MSARKGRSKKAHPSLMSKTGILIMKDEKKAEILSNYFSSVFTGHLFPHLLSGWLAR